MCHEAVVRLLVERNDVDINAQDNHGRVLLSVAENGMRLLCSC